MASSRTCVCVVRTNDKRRDSPKIPKYKPLGGTDESPGKAGKDMLAVEPSTTLRARCEAETKGAEHKPDEETAAIARKIVAGLKLKRRKPKRAPASAMVGSDTTC